MGYVGITISVCFSDQLYPVIGVDIDEAKANDINHGSPPFFERDLPQILDRVVKQGILQCTSSYEQAISNSDTTFLCVGTPSRPDGALDLQHVKSAAEAIGRALKNKPQYHLVAVKSTVTPGTAENVVKPILEKFSGKTCGVEFGLCSNPEFLREGSAIHDNLNPDRIVIGDDDKAAGDKLEDLYQEFYRKKLPPIIRTTLSTAELIKYANNAFLATKVSFINTIANICEKIPGADVRAVALALGLDSRIGSKFLDAGLGWGGSCWPKDLRALLYFCQQLGYDPKILRATLETNENQPLRAVALAQKLMSEIRGRRIAVLGLAFKPGTDDMREAVSVKIVTRLLSEGAKVVVHDPMAIENARRILPQSVEYATSVHDCLQQADCALIVTEWKEFAQLRAEDFIRYMKTAILIDGRRIYNPEEFRGKVKFAAIGLGKQFPQKTSIRRLPRL